MSSDSLAALTKTQRQYLALVSLGLTSKEIGRIVGREPSAIDTACKRALAATGMSDRVSLGRLLAERDPEMVQSVAQRYGLSLKALADLHVGAAVEPASGLPSMVAEHDPERSRNNLSAWQKRLLAVALAFGVLAIAAMLVEGSRRVLMGFSAIF